MKKFVVDANMREDLDTIILRFDLEENRQHSADDLREGERVILHEPGDFECQAIVRRGIHDRWVAKIIDETIVYL